MVHENQNHEYFEVKGGGRRRLRHVDGDFPSCMRKTKKEQHPEDDLRVWMEGRGGGRKEPRLINGDVPRCMRNKEETLKFRSKNEGRGSSGKARKENSSKKKRCKVQRKKTRIQQQAAKEEKNAKTQAAAALLRKRHCGEAKTEARSNSL